MSRYKMDASMDVKQYLIQMEF